MKKLVISLLVLSLVGCASQPKLNKQTQSGKPEGDYQGKTIEQVSSSLVRFCNKNGFMVEESTQSSVICSKVREGGSGVMAQLLIGNAYSTPPVDKVRFSISKGESSSHVWADMWMETQMPGGQINKMQLTDNNSKNFFQYVLDNIKIN